jgi:hypothetical protein
MRYRDRLRIWESNYGRSLGWDLELDGRVVGLLDEPRWRDMFWTSYRLSSTGDDPAVSTGLVSADFWKGNGYAGLVFRSRALGLVAEQPFPAVDAFVGPGRVSMRALYVGCRPPALWDRLVLKIRAVLRARQAKRALR